MMIEILDTIVGLLPSIFEIVFSLLVFISVAMIRPIRYKVLKVLANSMSKTHGFKVMSEEDTIAHRRIHDLVVTLRSQINSDRVSIFQFENGSRFSLSNPTWKITQTYESVSDGRMYFSETIKREPVTQLLEMVIPLFNPSEDYPGVDKIKVKVNDFQENTVFVLSEDKLPNCKYRYELLRRGSKISYLVPLRNDSGKLFGICSLAYTYNKNLTSDELLTIVSTVDRIQTYLNSMFINSLKK